MVGKTGEVSIQRRTGHQHDNPKLSLSTHPIVHPSRRLAKLNFMEGERFERRKKIIEHQEEIKGRVEQSWIDQYREGNFQRKTETGLPKEIQV